MYMLRTHQERDHVDVFEQHDYVEARQHSFKERWDNEVRQAEGLSPNKQVNIGVRQQAKRFDTGYDDPGPAGPSSKPGKHIRRNPKD